MSRMANVLHVSSFLSATMRSQAHIVRHRRHTQTYLQISHIDVVPLILRVCV